MKIARLLAGITLLGWTSLMAADSPPVPFIIGGDEIIEPSAVESSVDLVLPEEPVIPALDEPIAISAEIDEPLDLGILEDELIFEEPEIVLDEQAVPVATPIEESDESIVASDDMSLPFMLDDMEDSLAMEPMEEGVESTVEEEAPMIVLTPDMGEMPSEDEIVEPMVIPQNAIATSEEPVMIDLEDLDAMVEDETLDPVVPIIAPVSSETTTEAPVFVDNGAVGVKTITGPQEEWGPAYEVSMEPKRIVGPDGSEHIEGLEHIIGRSNPVLQEVKGVRRTIAEVGQGFPALHVDQIALDDLLLYLRNFTNKHLESRLSAPLYVTMDIQPESVEEVFEYIKANYPVDVIDMNGSLVVVPQQPVGQDMLAMGEVDGRLNIEEGTAGALAYNENGNPIMPGDTLQNMMAASAMHARAAQTGSMTLQNGGMPSPVVGAAPTDNSNLLATMPAPTPAEPSMAPVAGGVNGGMMVTESMWRDMQRKAHMYELNRRREELLAQREKIERELRDYHLARRQD